MFHLEDELMGKYIDLHIHSNRSDGVLSPKEIFDEAQKQDVEMISITDHDVFNNLSIIQTLVNEYESLVYVPGIEISSFFRDRKLNNILIHILGYGCSSDDRSLNQVIEYLKQSRTKINEQYIKGLLSEFPKLKEEMLVDVDCTRYYRLARAIIRSLKDNSAPEELLTEIKRYCSKNIPRYENYDVDSKIVTEAILSSGGIPILAHPMEYRLRDIELKRMIKSLVNLGIEGIESNHSDSSLEQMKRLRMLAESYKILYSCGSDFHLHSETYNKVIGHGLDDNLCVENTSLADKILEKSLHLKKEKK